MGEHETSSQAGLLLSGLLPNATSNVNRVLDAERWSKAEERIAELVACIQPSRPSEDYRNAVAKYVRKLIMKCFVCEVFTYGSVPFKTYLTDGDIDFTAFSMNKDLKDTWANAVVKVLEKEEKNENAEFRVKEIHYIRAEVKVIKCIVENIVVDISFGQVGGLSTLCFLEEVDHLISHNHLFKRSIILVKAWCYYESRILGAYHGFISTYALEILVLYIFHVYNNTFAGPLEVLYRFLEFFSNFDWENFCVSLWGPVPISSLPDMTAELPRKDGGKLLFDKLFLEACSAVYGAPQGGQEYQRQQFVSKYFNVIDPLRTNNNLGRSVNKGSFYRIRTAFAFGAKKLANLLDCPKESLIAEVDRFFMNTWDRHQSDYRPDVPTYSIRCLQPLINCPNEGSNDSSGTTSLKKKSGSIGLQVSHEYQAGRGRSSHVLNTITKQGQRTHRTANAVHVNSIDASSLERNAISSSSIHSEKYQKNSRPDNSVSNNEEKIRFQFSRTPSELTEILTDALFPKKHNINVEASKTHNEQLLSEDSSRRKIIDSEVPTAQSARFSFDDPKSLRQSSPQQSLEVATDSIITSNSYLDNSGSTTAGAALASDSEALELRQQEEQNLVNLMASFGNPNLIGQVQLPLHLFSRVPFTMSPVLASMSYDQRNLTGIVPSNITLIDPSWGSGMQFIGGLGSAPLPHYCTNTTQNSNSEKDDLVIDKSGESSLEDGENGIWHDHDAGSMGGFETKNEGLKIHSDESQHQTASRYIHIPTSRGNVSRTSVTRSNHKVAAEFRGHRDDYLDAFQYQTGRANDVSATDRNVNSRFASTTQSSSFQRKYSSDASRDLLNSRVTKTARDKWGRKPSLSVVTTPFSGQARSGWQFEGASEHNSLSRVEYKNRDCFPPLSTEDTSLEDYALGSVPSASLHDRNQLSEYETAQISVADILTSLDPAVIWTSEQKAADYSAAGNLFEQDNGEQHCRSPSHQDIDIVEKYNQSEDHMNPVDLNTTRIAAPVPSEVLETDILHSDFASYWQNLLYGRLCQDTPNHGPFVYSPPVFVPPVYLQGHYPLNGPVRPPIANINFLPQNVGYDPRLVPVTSLLPGPSRPSSGYNGYENIRPRFRDGTGTYFPNPKSSFRGRKFSNKRNHRGGYNYGSSDRKDREGSWINPKAQSASLHARTDTAGRIYDQRPADVNPTRTNDQRHGAYRRGSSHSSPEKASSLLTTRQH